MLGLGYVTRYFRMDAVLGLAFTRTGWLFPFFGTYIGWLGVALTGSDTSQTHCSAACSASPRATAPEPDSNVRNQQRRRRGWAKWLTRNRFASPRAPQIRSARKAAFSASCSCTRLRLAAIVGVIVMLYAYVFPQFIPHGLTLSADGQASLRGPTLWKARFLTSCAKLSARAA